MDCIHNVQRCSPTAQSANSSQQSPQNSDFRAGGRQEKAIFRLTPVLTAVLLNTQGYGESRGAFLLLLLGVGVGGVACNGKGGLGRLGWEGWLAMVRVV